VERACVVRGQPSREALEDASVGARRAGPSGNLDLNRVDWFDSKINELVRLGVYNAVLGTGRLRLDDINLNTLRDTLLMLVTVTD
jgi:hypothetical protein